MGIVKRGAFRAVLIVGGLALGLVGCTPVAPTPTPAATTADTPIVEQTPIDTTTYTVADIDSVDLVEITDTESDTGCYQWHVQLGADAFSGEGAGTAWHSDTTCTEDPTTDLVGQTVQLSDKQVTDFRTTLDQIGVSTWSTWLDANDSQADDQTPSVPYYTVSLLVDSSGGLFYDSATVSDMQPPNWAAFVAAIKTVSGDTAS